MTFTVRAKVVAKAKTIITGSASVCSTTADPDASNNSATVRTSVQGGSPGKG